MSSTICKRGMSNKIDEITLKKVKVEGEGECEAKCMAKNTKRNAQCKRRKNARKTYKKAVKKYEGAENKSDYKNIHTTITVPQMCAQANAQADIDQMFTDLDTGDSLPISTMLFHHHATPEAGVRMISKWSDTEKALPLMNIIVCVRDGTSYDPIYESVQPNVPNGRTAVYIVSYSIINTLHNLMTGVETFTSIEADDSLKDLYTDIGSVNKEDIVFYWECCSHCVCQFRSSENSSRKSTCSLDRSSLQFISYLVKTRNIMVMCADFSLKGLIDDWDMDLLGPNPFVLLGDTSVPIELKFDQRTLLDSGSAQLESVGKLSENGTATIGVMPGTIVYSVKPVEDAPYIVNVLTVSQTDDCYSHSACTTSDGNHTGTAGQVILKYPGGGSLLVSNGHFIELQKLDTTIARLLAVATQEYGKAYSDGLAQNYNSLSASGQQALLQRETSRYISGAPPCQRSQSQATQGSMSC